MPDETPAESSPAVAQAEPAPSFADFRSSENAKAMGKPDSSKPAASTPAPATTEPVAATIPESQPGPEGKPEGKGPKTADDRVQELLRDRAKERLRAETAEAKLKALETPKPGEPKTDPPPAAQTKPDADPEPVEPKEKDFGTYEEYQAADRKYLRELARWEGRQETRRLDTERTAQAEKSTVEKNWNERVTAARAKHADFETIAKEIPFNQTAAAFILDSEVGPEILYHLGSNRELAERIKGLTPIQTARELTKIESTLQTPAPAATPAPGPKRVPSAPAPPSEVGNRPAGGADEAEEALAAGDFARYSRIMNSQEIAKTRR